MLFEELRERVPDAKAKDWAQHANGGGWVHKTA